MNNYEKPIITIYDDVEFFEDIDKASNDYEYWILEDNNCPFYGFDKNGQIMKVLLENKFLTFYFDGDYNESYMKSILINRLINHYDFNYLQTLSPKEVFELAENIYPYNK